MRTSGRLLPVLFAIGLMTLGGTTATAPARAQDAAQIAGTAAVSGTVEAPKPFQAAQVHFLNVDKNVLFMVYTSGGRYRAVNLFPRGDEKPHARRRVPGDAEFLAARRSGATRPARRVRILLEHPGRHARVLR
ncbi:MAG: hypothetical protein DME05_23950 [Candidatus Rokuibacteriota bacterium]|nr:MAG: hypothetical protein DME05_23950 [Candidatus Rokubacteria bacterium]